MDIIDNVIIRKYFRINPSVFELINVGSICVMEFDEGSKSGRFDNV